MIETADEYQELAERTMDKTRSFSKELITFGLGIAGEAGEVAELLLDDHGTRIEVRDKVIKEVGDVLWYTSGLGVLLKRKLSDIFGGKDNLGHIDMLGIRTENREELVLRLVVRACKVADYVKKVEGHGHKLDHEKLFGLVQQTALAIPPVSMGAWAIKMSDIATTNIEKLKKRYPEGFTEERSKNRVD